jgi:hypothetical protein
VQELLIEDWQRLESTKSRIEHLFNAYWRQQMFQRPNKIDIYTTIIQLRYLLDKHFLSLPVELNDNQYINFLKPPSKKQTRHWLVYLAQQLQRESKAEFAIDKMQPSYINNSAAKFLWRIVSGLVFGVIFGVSLGGIVTLCFNPKVGLISGLLTGLSWGITYTKIEKIEPVDKLIFSYKQLYSGFLTGLPWLVIIGIISWFIGELYLILITEITFIIMFVFPKGFMNSEIKPQRFANQGIYESIINACKSTLLGAAIGVLPLGLMSESLRLKAGVPLWIGSILVGALSSASVACIQHFILRLILYRDGYIPWNYARFLDYCTERLFLQRVGGRYRFIHRLLQEHFAEMPLEK